MKGAVPVNMTGLLKRLPDRCKVHLGRNSIVFEVNIVADAIELKELHSSFQELFSESECFETVEDNSYYLELSLEAIVQNTRVDP